MEKMNKILFSLVILVVLFVVFYFLSSLITKYTGLFVSENMFDKDKEFAECLERNVITLYINSENPHETLKELQIEDFITHISIFNCLRNHMFCLEKHINKFPSLIINGKKYYGDISVRELSKITGC